jgi:methionyl-tRNA formyltransferase
MSAGAAAASVQPLAATPEPRAANAAEPGTLLDDALLVRAGRDALRITRLQAPGRAPLDADAFLRGRKMPAGTRLGGSEGA